ncbi:hypothetical protein FJY70_04350 [candidate division WOR-3 bacterium]|nr:hypothetical protein [candidate division WOR-3 bacterium]
MVISTPEEQQITALQRAGGALQRIQTPYTTAVAVQKPRDLDKVVAIIDREAQYAGEDFYYLWEANDRRRGRKVEIFGPSYGCIVACCRAYGNCVLPPVEAQQVEPGSILLNAGFCDLESGFTIYRSLKHTPTAPPGKFGEDEEQSARWYDMQFQLSQSKVQRNVGRAGIPNWLVQRAIDKARDAARANISKEGIEKSLAKGLELLSGLLARPMDVIKKAVVAKWGKELMLATVEDIEDLRTAYSAIRQSDDPEVMACSVFPLLAEVSKTNGKTPAPTVADLNVGKPPVTPPPPVVKADTPENPPVDTPKDDARAPLGLEVVLEALTGSRIPRAAAQKAIHDLGWTKALGDLTELELSEVIKLLKPKAAK